VLRRGRHEADVEPDTKSNPAYRGRHEA
jgi:hypothetical protein